MFGVILSIVKSRSFGTVPEEAMVTRSNGANSSVTSSGTMEDVGKVGS